MTKRVLFLAMAVLLLLGMSAPAFASSVDTQGTGFTLHTPLTYTNGTRPADASTKMYGPNDTFPVALKYPEQYKRNNVDIQFFGGTFRVGVGETITLRLLQRELSVDGKTIYNISTVNVEDFYTYLTDSDSVKDWDNTTVSDLPKTADGNPYIDIYITGVKEGTVDILSRMPAYGARALYKIVVGPGSGSAAAPSTAKAPATSNTPAPKAPAAPTGDNTVTVAGTQRTPGRVQQYANGYVYTVNYGDTLYDICAHFYGNGDLWKELQAVNQENLNATTDDMIFVGFNLILPNELGGASIR